MKWIRFEQDLEKPEGYGTYFHEERERVVKGWYGTETKPEYVFKRYLKEGKGNSLKSEELRWDYDAFDTKNMTIAEFFKKHVNRYLGGILPTVESSIYIVNSAAIPKLPPEDGDVDEENDIVVAEDDDDDEDY